MPAKVNIVKRVYPSKILVAWAEAIDGNLKIKDWLIKNGYPELGLFVHALHLQDEARDWLMKNGFPHLMATINGVEGKEDSVKWLDHFGFPTLALVARAADGNDSAMAFLLAKDKVFAVIAQKIKKVKDDIERNNSSHYRISKV